MDIVGLVIGLMGIAVMLWGVLIAFVSLVRIEIRRVSGQAICKRREYLRHHLGSYLLLGLEFLIAADIVHTILDPDLESLLILGSIVAIRTVISIFLNRELQGGHDCGDEGVRG
jgi:uncharacterized membrane protein